ncbi:MAG: 30S ribosome-binding factor RbfA [Firmicutes bacterium]|nr:30S ribosome-binding factor RbfA [Bacillota bacterium]
MKKGSNRMIRINDEIQKEISAIIRGDLKDPRVGVITSVLKVDTTNDLKYCKVYISVLGDDEKKQEVMGVLKNAAGFIRSLIAQRINLRLTPELKFILDDSLEYSFKIDSLIRSVVKDDEENTEADESNDDV